MISYVKKLDVNGLEITFSSKEELYAFKLSKANEKYLKNLDYVTIHAPFKLVRKADNKEEIIKQLDLLSILYNKLNVKNIIIHPKDLPEPKILNDYDFNISTENLPKKTPILISEISDLKKILKEYPKMGLCLDVSHAYLWSKYETEKMTRAFEDKITQIHFSGTHKKRDHRSLRIVSKDFMFSINPIFKLNVPIVVEEDIETKSTKFLKEEIDFIKNMLGKINKLEN